MVNKQDRKLEISTVDILYVPENEEEFAGVCVRHERGRNYVILMSEEDDDFEKCPFIEKSVALRLARVLTVFANTGSLTTEE